MNEQTTKKPKRGPGRPPAIVAKLREGLEGLAHLPRFCTREELEAHHRALIEILKEAVR